MTSTDEEGSKLNEVRALLNQHFSVQLDLKMPLIDFIGTKAAEIGKAYNQRNDGICLSIGDHYLRDALATPVRFLPTFEAEQSATRIHEFIKQCKIDVAKNTVWLGFKDPVVRQYHDPRDR